MSIFGLEPFDERLEAIQNKAGRVAFEAMYIALLLSLVVYTQVTGHKNDALQYFVLGVATLGMAVNAIILNRNGLTWDVIREEQYRLGKAPGRAKRYIRKQVLFIISFVSVITLSNRPVKDIGWTEIILFVFYCVVGGVVMYKSANTNLTVKPLSLIKAEKRGEVDDAAVPLDQQ